MNTAHVAQRLTIVCLMWPKAEQTETVRQALLALVGPTRAEPGCLAYNLYEEEDGLLLLIESWRSSNDLEAHQQLPAVRELFREQLPDRLVQPMDVHYGAALEPTSRSIN